MTQFGRNIEQVTREIPTALITGGASGIGRATVEYLSYRGWRVIAADIDKDGLDTLPDFVFPVYLDVANEATFATCLEEIKQITDGLDAIVNCAGILVVGSMIEVPEDDIIKILKVNLFGTYRVNRVFFPMVLKRGGRIVVMSSEIGVQTTFPFNGPYAISKYAIEAYADALRRELSFLGIHVIKIRAGAVKSRMVEGVDRVFQKAALSSTHFFDLISKNIDLARGESAKAIDPKIVVKKIYQGLTARRPKSCYSIKLDLRRTMLSRLPVSISDQLITWFLSK